MWKPGFNFKKQKLCPDLLSKIRILYGLVRLHHPGNPHDFSVHQFLFLVGEVGTVAAADKAHCLPVETTKLCQTSASSSLSLLETKVSVGNVERSVKILSVCASLLQNFQSRPFISSQDHADLTYYILLALGMMMRYNLVMTMTQTRTHTKTNGSGSKDKSKSLQKVQILKFRH